MAVTKQQDNADLLNEGSEGVERFDPAAMHGSLLEAEHLARYWWASRLVSDKRVLDAGCGPGRHAKKLLAKGAHVTGIDISEEMVNIARAHCGGRGHFFRAAFQIDGNLRDWSDQKDGPALQSLAFVAAWPFLDDPSKETAKKVAQRSLDGDKLRSGEVRLCLTRIRAQSKIW